MIFLPNQFIKYVILFSDLSIEECLSQIVRKEKNMLSVKENFLETIKKDGNPDRLVNGYEFMGLVVPDPALLAVGHGLQPGQQGPDGFGVIWEWSEGQPAAAPLCKEEVILIKDISEWESKYNPPNIEDLDWSMVQAQAEEIRKTDQFVTAFMPFGFFERMHFLMGFENCMINMMIEPEATKDLMAAIQKHRMRVAELFVEKLNPEMVFIHDDWGMKRSLFTSPEVWRDMFKDHFTEFYAFFKDRGIINIHHADSFMEPIVSDMVDMKIDVWQGVLPENDIPKLQKELDGNMVLMGGIDATVCDAPSATEEDVRKEARRVLETYAPGGHFIPSFTYGGPMDMLYMDRNEFIKDEVRKYNIEVFGTKYE